MWRRRAGGSSLAALVFAGLAVMPPQALAQERPMLPAGPGSEVVTARCLTCHDADLITQQRLDEAGWRREIDKMVRWGATVADEERPMVVSYLVQRAGRRAGVTPRDVGGAAAAVFARACVGCHQADIVEQQRLSRAGWARELDKMIRWGARVDDADREPLIDYLAGRP